MPPSSAGQAPAPITTEPAGSRENQSRVYVGPRIVAREFSRLFRERHIAVHPAEVRVIAAKFCSVPGRQLADVEAYVLAYADPTGETAARNVDRGGAA